jgi:hypothetical protein
LIFTVLGNTMPGRRQYGTTARIPTITTPVRKKEGALKVACPIWVLANLLSESSPSRWKKAAKNIDAAIVDGVRARITCKK